MKRIVKRLKRLERTKRCKGLSSETYHMNECGNYILDGQKLCDNCLLGRFRLEARYDSEDTWSMSPLYQEEQVLQALREASKL